MTMDQPVPVRPLPQPTLSTAAFWKSGADGVLRISRCDECERYFHPPMPICPSCRSRAVSLAPTSGKAVVVGCSVNHQAWLPDFPPPYVVAVVTLAEDDRARLTTNIVGCAPELVHVGMRVRVRFEPHEDVFIPLFEPDPDEELAAGPAALPEPQDIRTMLRPMVSHRKYEDRVALTGVGQSQVGRRLMIDPISLTVDACLAAVADAGLELDEIDGLSTYPGAGAPGGLGEGGITALTEALQLRPTWVNGGREVPGQIGSLTAAMLAVAAGLCRHVLCFRTVWESSYSSLVRSGRWQAESGRAAGMLEWRAPFGAVSAAQWIACNASHYMHRYGVGRDALGAIAVTARAGAMRNPEAIYRDPLTLDDYFDARMVTTPFGLYDCDVPCDGAVAVIVSAIETCLDRPRPPILVESVGTAVLERLSWDQGTLTHLPQSLGPSAHLWTRTDLSPADVDVALLYDGFTFNALSWLEGLGFCGAGEATDYLAGGKTIALDGELPLNPHGGQLSAGRLHGYGFVREAIMQLRHDAGDRQVRNARVAVVTAGGGIPSGAMLLRAP